MPNLGDSTERLYRAFVGVPRPAHIDACPCCLDRHEIGTLLRTPLRGLTPGELSSYASSAFLTVGAAADYLYFLPRILEVSATEPGWWPDPEVTGRAVRETAPAAWPDDRRAALTGFLDVVIAAAIAADDHGGVDSWVCAVARMGLDVRPLLGRVAACPAAVRGFYRENADGLPHGRLANAFWEPPCPGHDAVLGWLASAAAAAHLDGAAGVDSDAYGAFRCVYGNRLDPLVADPTWLTVTVVRLAGAIAAEASFDRLPVLADALEEAGCDDPEVLNHCRSAGPHVRGCWVVGLVVGAG